MHRRELPAFKHARGLNMAIGEGDLIDECTRDIYCRRICKGSMVKDMQGVYVSQRGLE
jgi:hypothetical protein